MDSSNNVIGLDLSLTGAGLCDLDLDKETFECDTFGTTGKRADTYVMRHGRLDKMANYIIEWATAGWAYPQLVVIEAPSYGSRVGSQHDRSGLWWMVVDALLDREIPVAFVSPKSRAKYATGSGNAGKDVVLAHVIERYGDMVPESRIRNDNEADALVLAAMGARLLGFPLEEELHADNLAAMDAVQFDSDGMA